MNKNQKNEKEPMNETLGYWAVNAGFLTCIFGVGQLYERSLHTPNVTTEFQETLIDVFAVSPEAKIALGGMMYIIGAVACNAKSWYQAIMK